LFGKLEEMKGICTGKGCRSSVSREQALCCRELSPYRSPTIRPFQILQAYCSQLEHRVVERFDAAVETGDETEQVGQAQGSQGLGMAVSYTGTLQHVTSVCQPAGKPISTPETTVDVTAT
jgi:hypothetical protein